MTPVAVRSVAKVITALVLPESSTLVLSGNDIRFNERDVDQVFPEISVAIAVTVLSPPVRS